MKSISFPIKDAVKDKVTLRVSVTGTKEYKIRLMVAQALIRLAAWIAWIKVEMETE